MSFIQEAIVKLLKFIIFMEISRISWDFHCFHFLAFLLKMNVYMTLFLFYQVAIHLVIVHATIQAGRAHFMYQFF